MALAAARICASSTERPASRTIRPAISTCWRSSAARLGRVLQELRRRPLRRHARRSSNCRRFWPISASARSSMRSFVGSRTRDLALGGRRALPAQSGGHLQLGGMGPSRFGRRRLRAVRDLLPASVGRQCAGARTSGSSARGCSIAYSLLIKPQAAVLLPLMLAFALVDRDAPARSPDCDRRRHRRRASCWRSSSSSRSTRAIRSRHSLG